MRLKVAVNRSFGGFQLSRQCFLELLNRKLLGDRGEVRCIQEVSPLPQYIKEGFPGHSEPVQVGGGTLPNLYWGEYSDHYIVDWPGDRMWSLNDTVEGRSCPALISVLENEGSEWASGRASKIVVHEIYLDLEVRDYDGMERVWVGNCPLSYEEIKKDATKD